MMLIYFPVCLEACYNDCGDYMDAKTIEKTYALIDAIKAHPDYTALKEARRALDASQEVSELSKTFKACEADYNEAKRHGQHHPDYSRYKTAFQSAAHALFAHPLVKEYKACERRMNAHLQDIATTLASGVSARISVENSLNLSIGG